jgi:Holliday junction resolvase
MNDDDDFFLEDLSKEGKPKRMNSGRKGKSGERTLAKILSERFVGHEPFSRVIGSGNRWAQVTMTEAAKNVMTGDLVCPAGFRFCIECKYGYDDIDLANALDGGNKQLDSFLKQAEDDAGRAKREPLLCWRKPRQAWVAFTKIEIPEATYQVRYRDWWGLSLNCLLTQPDSFFF